MVFPFALRSLKSTLSAPALVVAEPQVSLTSFEDLFMLRLSNLSLPAALASLVQLLKTNPSVTYSSFASLLGNLDLSSILPSKQKQEVVSETPSHSFPLATFADEIAFERQEEQQQRAQRTLDVDAAFLKSFPLLLTLHLTLELPDALFAKKQQLVEETLEKLVSLMTDESTGERLKAAGSLPESIRMAFGLEGEVSTGTEGWEFVESVVRRLKERVEQAQLSSSSSSFNSLGNGSSISSPLSNQATRILILTHYLIGRTSSPSSFNLTDTSLGSYARCLDLAQLDASFTPVTSSSVFFTANGSTYIAHLLVKATKILEIHRRVKREVSRKEEKRIAASTVARIATEKSDRDFDERMTRIASKSRLSRHASSKSSGSPLSMSVGSLDSTNSTPSPVVLTPPSTPPRSLKKVRVISSSSVPSPELPQGEGAVWSLSEAGKGRLEDAFGSRRWQKC